MSMQTIATGLNRERSSQCVDHYGASQSRHAAPYDSSETLDSRNGTVADVDGLPINVRFQG